MQTSNPGSHIIVNLSGFADPTVSSRMTDFKASVVAFEVQKNFANKFFSNKVVVKGLIDDTSAKLLDNLYNLLFVFVSIDLLISSSSLYIC